MSALIPVDLARVEAIRRAHEADEPWYYVATPRTQIQADFRVMFQHRAFLLDCVTRLAEEYDQLLAFVGPPGAMSYEELANENARLAEAVERGEKALDAEQEECATWRMQVERLRAALEPFASGGDWGQVKAWIVEGADACGHPREAGIQAAVRIGKWQVTVDAALAPRPAGEPS